MNLLKETRKVLEYHKKTGADVEWCAVRDTWFSWEDFERLADFDYDNGYGGEEVATSLLVVGKDFWLERHEYDGSEWWEFKTMSTKPVNRGAPENLLS